MSDLIYLTDRSAAETDDACGMRFWLNRKEGGTGIVPVAEPDALAVGRAVHEDFATIAEWPRLDQQSVQDAITSILTAVGDFAKLSLHQQETLYRRLGWIAAWALFKEPTIRVSWENIHIEKELILDRTPLLVACTPDRVLKHKETKFLKYLEYKSTISVSQKWLDSWRYAIQLHIGIAAVQEELTDPIKYATVVGLMKGNLSAATHHLMHPYVWGYYNSTTKEWTHLYEKARSANWASMPVWEYPGGVVEWVTRCGQEVADQQFPTAPPVMLDERMLAEWVARRTAREQQIAMVEAECRGDLAMRSLFFERRTSKCKPAWGDACPYLMACWNASVAADPAKHPNYVVRTPHHDLETIGIL